MIERLELRGWRAFDSVAIDFSPGTTFLVAPNGVGKTSLLLGLHWALFGEHSDVDAKACVRINHSTAEATVSLSTRDGALLTIRRTVKPNGRTTVDHTIGEQALDDSAATDLLEREFGTSIEIAARLAVIRGSGGVDGELQLSEHLYDAFGVSGLRRAADQAVQLHKQAERDRKKLRTASKSQLANRDELIARAESLHSELADLGNDRKALADAVSAAQHVEQALRRWQAYDDALEDRSTQIEQLLAEQSKLGLEAGSLPELAAMVSSTIDARLTEIDRTQSSLTEAKAHALAAQSALDLMEAHSPSCPTCARPFDGDELDQAIAAQQNSLTLAQRRSDEAEREFQQLSDEKEMLTALESKAAELVQPLNEPEADRPSEEVETLLSAAQAALKVHDERAGGVAGERNAILAQLSNDAELKAAYAAERVAWHREALTRAAAHALTNTADRVASEHIEPLSQRVRWRWKALFGEDGLQLKPDGTIVRVVDDREIPWHLLSGAEQLWARLVASLLVLQSSTTVPFAWLDEPLEHLDPRARRIVATDLAGTPNSGSPTQLIVTTYEHTLARQLAEDVDRTHLHHINRTDQPDVSPERWEEASGAA